MTSSVAVWPTATLAELGGRVTSGSRGWAAHYADHGSLFLRITNLRRDRLQLDLNSSRFVNVDPGDVEARRTRLELGDLLISITADIGIIGYVDETVPFPAYINQHIARVRLDQRRADSRFVAYYLASWEPQRLFVGSTDTGAKAGMNLATVAALSTVVPSLPEQRRIASALRDADDLIATLERMIVKKRAIKQGMMQELLTGKTRLPGFTEPWSEGTFERLAIPSKERAMPSNVPSTTPLVELEQLESGSGRLLRTSQASEAVSLKAVFKPGDVLFGKLRAYLRKFWYADIAGLCTTEIWVLRSRPGVCSSFVRYVVETEEFIDVASGAYGTHMPRSDWGTVRALPVAIPAHEEQVAIASALNDVDAELGVLHRRLIKARGVKQGMMQELLTGRSRLPLEEAA